MEAEQAQDSALGTRHSALAGRAAPARPARRAGWVASIRRQRLAVVGAAIVGFFVVLALVGPRVAPYSPTEQHIRDRLRPPNGTYLLGSDEFGRDILSRLLYGAGISFQVGIIAVGLSGVVGVLLGLIAGYVGGWLDGI